ncbi:hypothetical protein CLV51_1011634 [Chitinophaga niastensis]|uniref:ABC-2 type transport system permease protein n=1 Tax=Chitinophaga niastensis TaxID=536980 RepID=A0A2P8HVP1_CHINA|nr:hypothetical protein [Chitinophaga niastensis]PSL50290.1 hypothetical protein CLV51_1011634 [Chitinophaga niastensis]
MNYPARILFQSLIKSFYRENAGAILFFITMLFLIVAPTHGAGLIAYHHSLIIGLLQSNTFLLLVFFVWLLYTRKCVAFVADVLGKPEYTFIHIFNYLGKAKRFRLFFFVEVCLLMPVLLYAALIIIVGWQQHFYFAAMLVLGYTLLLCTASTVRHVYLLNNLERKTQLSSKKAKWISKLLSVYPVILIQSVANNQKFLWLGIKVFTCGILYGIAQNNTIAQYDAGSVFWFFNFGIIANGVLVFRTREFEETYLAFYRGAPVSLLKRFLGYSLVCFMLLFPEFITIGMLVPVHLHYSDAISFALGSYSLVLLMNSITFLHRFSMKTYLKIVLLITCIQFIFLVFAALTALYLLFFILAVICFMVGYYKFE